MSSPPNTVSKIMNDMSQLSSLLENLPDSIINNEITHKGNNIIYGDITTKTQKKWPYEKLLQYTPQGLMLRKKSNNDLEVCIKVSIADNILGYVGKPSCFNKYPTRDPTTGHPGCIAFSLTKNKKSITECQQHISPMTEDITLPIHVRMDMLKSHYDKSFLQRVKKNGTAEEKKTLFIKMIKRYHNAVNKDKSSMAQLFAKDRLSRLLKGAATITF